MLDEYDLYDKVHKPASSKPIPKPRRFINGQKSLLLTAKSLDSHYTDGHHDWCLLDCGCDMYRILTNQLGDPRETRSRIETGELVFFDFQPLSTRLALMTKFIVIAQGGTAIPSKYITVYESLTSPNTTTPRSKSFDSSLLGSQRKGSSSCPKRGIVMPNSGLYVKIWSNDDVKMSVFGTDPYTRMNRANCESCRLVPSRTLKPSVSNKISLLMSNFEPASKRPEGINDGKVIWTESSISETSLKNNSCNEHLITANIQTSNKTVLTKSSSENNPRVLNTGVRTTETIETTTCHTQDYIHHHPPKPAQRVSIPIRIEDPSLAGTTNLLSDGTVREPKTEVITYSYRKLVEPAASSMKSRGSSTDVGGKKREQVRFDDSWEKAEHSGSQKKLLRSSEWALAKQLTVKKEF